MEPGDHIILRPDPHGRKTRVRTADRRITDH